MQNAVKLAALCTAVLALGLACSSEDDVIYGDPARVAGGATTVSATSTSTSTGTGGNGGGGGSCEVDPACTSSFATDVLADALIVGGGCTTTTCHGAPASSGNLTFSADPTEAYDVLKNYMLDDATKGGAYIVPCNPQASRILCNLKVDPASGTNPYDTCGSTMPLAGGVTLDQLDKVATWIQCGAPNN